MEIAEDKTTFKAILKELRLDLGHYCDREHCPPPMVRPMKDSDVLDDNSSQSILPAHRLRVGERWGCSWLSIVETCVG